MPEEDHNLYEQLIKRLISVPISKKSEVFRVRKGRKVKTIYLKNKNAVYSRNGTPETEEGREIHILDDGTGFSGREYIGICQRCNGLVNMTNLRRCVCGQTVCIRRGCGKIYGKNWYCGFFCVLSNKLGLLRKL